MQTFTVKSASRKNEDREPYFFVLNKGLNSGKPLLQPCPNCFKVEAETIEFRDILYWVSFALWKSKAFHPYFCGSVIPFIRINDFRNLVTEKLEVIKTNPTGFVEVVNKLRLIEENEQKIAENLKLIRELKTAYIHNYFNK